MLDDVEVAARQVEGDEQDEPDQEECRGGGRERGGHGSRVSGACDDISPTRSMRTAWSQPVTKRNHRHILESVTVSGRIKPPGRQGGSPNGQRVSAPKMAGVFKAMDDDGDGHLEESDFGTLTERWVDLGGWSRGPPTTSG